MVEIEATLACFEPLDQGVDFEHAGDAGTAGDSVHAGLLDIVWRGWWGRLQPSADDNRRVKRRSLTRQPKPSLYAKTHAAWPIPQRWAAGRPADVRHRRAGSLSRACTWRGCLGSRPRTRPN